jgi:glycosyltransferase involved in cell wall biosynthesis
MRAISIVMPCHNRGHDLRRILDAYDHQDTSEPFEIIAVDDASTDGTFQILTNYHAERYELRVVRQEVNKGPGAARNRALELVDTPLVIIVGDDILPEQDFIRRHLQIHRIYPEPEYAVLGRVIWPFDMPVNTLMHHIDGVGAQQFSYHFLEDGSEYDYRHFYTANISIKRDLLSTVDHWFDPDFSYAAFEDVEIAYRLSKHGLRIIYSSAPVVRHYHYHTIWTFSERQYRAGLMACVLNRKHPGVAGRSSLLLRRFGTPIDWLAGFYRGLKPSCKGVLDWLEWIALHLASYYEWIPNPLLDDLYLKLLAYFWYKGVIYGSYRNPEDARRINEVYAFRRLNPMIKGFIITAQSLGIPLPPGYDAHMLQELRDLTRFSMMRQTLPSV